MNSTKKVYSREEKKKYFREEILMLEAKLIRLKRRLEYIESDQYQDWDSSLSTELKEKKEA